MKTCIKCNEVKDLMDFKKSNNRCISCIRSYARAYRKDYYKKNKKQIIQYSNNYLANTENGKKIRNKSANKYRKHRYKTDPLFKLRISVSKRLSETFKSKRINKNNTFFQYIGCSLEELKIHIEKQFKSGMTWKNHGKWHIDHIIPLASGKNEQELYKLSHYTNLQPLWALDNLKKKDNILK